MENVTSQDVVQEYIFRLPIPTPKPYNIETTNYENRERTSKKSVIKEDKRTKVNFSNSPSFIDFLIPGSQKKSEANHVKSRQQLSSRPKTVRHFYPTIRKRKLNYNKPFSSAPNMWVA